MVKLSPQEVRYTRLLSDFEQIETGFVGCWNFFRKRSAKNGTGRYSSVVSELLDLNFKTEMESYFQEFLKFQIDFKYS
jgi:hypothetical protein